MVLQTTLYRKQLKQSLSGDEKKIKDLIKKHTKLSQEHMTPEISLNLITKDCSLWNAKMDQPLPFCDPFWAFYWPGGQVLSR